MIFRHDSIHDNLFLTHPSIETHNRDFFLEPQNYKGCRSLMVQRTGELLRKIWNTRNFKGQVG